MALMLSGDLDAGQLVSLRPFCGLHELIARPSGVCFDDQGNLYVTCMTSRVRLGNPSFVTPGRPAAVCDPVALQIVTCAD